MTTAIGMATRESGNVIGNSLKSIFARITTNQSAISALEDIGISIYNTNGEIKTAQELIDETAKKWSTLTDEQRQNTSVGVAGVYQLSRWNALMLNYQTAIDATTTSMNSQNSAMGEQEKYNQSLEARLNRLNTAWYDLSATVGDTILYDGIVTVTAVLDKLVDVGDGVFSTYVGLPILFGAVGTGVFLLSSRMTGFTTSLIQNTAAQRVNSVASTTLTGKMYALAAGTGAASTAFRTFLSATGVGIGLIALGGIITLLTTEISKNVQAQEEFEAQQKKNVDAITTNKEQVSQLISEYERLDATRTSGSWNAEQEQEYLEVQQQLGELFPSLISHIDSTGQAHLKNRDAIQEEIKATEELIDTQNRMIVENASEEFKKLNNELDGAWYDSFSNFLYGSLGERIQQHKQIIEAMYESNADSGLIARTEFELKQLERQYQQTSEQIKGYIFDVAEAVNDLEISSGLSSSLQDFIYSLDLSNLDADNLESFAKEFGEIQEQLQNAINTGNEELFNSQIDALNELATETNGFDKELNSLLLTYDKHNKTLTNKTEIISVDTELMGESAEMAEEWQKVLDDTVNSISTLNKALEDYNSTGELSTETVLDLVEQYPQLLAYIGDEARFIEELTNIRDKDVNAAEQQIADKLSINEGFYNSNLKMLEEFIAQQFSFYDGDLKQFQNLAQAKADIETQLINKLAQQWGVYYSSLADSFLPSLEDWGQPNSSFWLPGMDDGTDNPAYQGMLKANEELEKFRNTFDNFSLDRINLDFQSIGTSSPSSKSSKGSSSNSKSPTDILKEQIDSQLALFERASSRYSNKLEESESNLWKFNEASEEYRNELSRQQMLLNNKRKVNNQEIAYLRSMLSSGKLTTEMTHDLTDRLEQLQIAQNNLTFDEQELSLRKINSTLLSYTENIDNLGRQLERSQTIQSLYEEGSEEWKQELDTQNKLLEQQAQLILDKRNALVETLRTENLSTEAIKEQKIELDNLSNAYWQTQQEIKSLEQSVKDYQESVATDIADTLIDSYKSYLNERKEDHINSIDEEAEREEKRHNKRMQQLEDEMDLYRKNVQERLDLINQEEAERTYDMEMSDLQSQREEINRQMNQLQLGVNSGDYEAKAEYKQLKEQLDEIDKQIAETQHERNIELQRESLDSLLETKEEEVSRQQELEEERYNDVVDKIDQEKQYWEKYYDDLANDERKFAQIRLAIMEGNFDDIQGEFDGYLAYLEESMPNIEFTLDNTMKSVGTSIRQNLIDNLREALDMMNELESSQGSSSSSSSNGNSSKSVSTSINSADMKVILGKYMASELAEKETIASRKKSIESTGWKLANEGRASGSQFSKTTSLDSILDGLNEADKKMLKSYLNSQANTIVQSDYLQDYIRKFAASLDTGGMTNFSGLGVDGKGGKLVIAHDNEIINNPINTENLLKA
ncbi:hypothetical protein D7X33_21395, partial [Butyricicoccus sp. 1XD8-22]